jgi:hypothetical protein
LHALLRLSPEERDVGYHAGAQSDQLSRTFDFFVPGPKAFEAGAKFLLARGYR